MSLRMAEEGSLMVPSILGSQVRPLVHLARGRPSMLPSATLSMECGFRALLRGSIRLLWSAETVGAALGYLSGTFLERWHPRCVTLLRQRRDRRASEVVADS